MLDKHSIKEVSWNDVSDDFKPINPELHRIIEELSPSPQMTLVKLTYAFGDVIVKNGVLQLPPSTLSSHAALNLDYSCIPLFCLMDHSCEVFSLDHERVVPLKIFSAGQLIGTFETTDYLLGQSQPASWYVTAGSRSLCTLPKISEQGRLKKLKNQFKIKSDTSVFSMQDHWYLFKQIAQDPQFTESWQLSVIVFTKSWFTHRYDVAWQTFSLYLLQQAWTQMQQLRAKDALALQWQASLQILAQRRIQPNPYITHTLQHLLLIAQNQVPAFHVMQDNQLAPMAGIKSVLSTIYGLKHNYYPTLMNVQMQSITSATTAYYSLAFPTLMAGSPASKCNTSTIMEDLKRLKWAIEILLKEQRLDAFRHLQLHFYHVETDKYSEIQSSTLIPDRDPSFQKQMGASDTFCATSPFWRGCIAFRYRPKPIDDNEVDSV